MIQHETDEILDELPTMELPAVDEVITECLLRLAEIQQQIDVADMKIDAEGTYPDPVWFAKAKAAKRHWGIVHQTALRRGAELRKAARQSTPNDKQRFAEVAARFLDPSVFLQLADEAGWPSDFAYTFLDWNRNKVPA